MGEFSHCCIWWKHFLSCSGAICNNIVRSGGNRKQYIHHTDSCCSGMSSSRFYHKAFCLLATLRIDMLANFDAILRIIRKCYQKQLSVGIPDYHLDPGVFHFLGWVRCGCRVICVCNITNDYARACLRFSGLVGNHTIDNWLNKKVVKDFRLDPRL